MIELPKTTDEGKPMISYSQIKAFKEEKGFNLKVEGAMEYFIKYFFGYKFGDVGWAEFGKDVEDYIANRGSSEKFDDQEKKILEKIQPLGVTGDKFYIDYGEFVLMGIIDDRTEDWSKLRDYKTASAKTKKQYELDSYTQLDLYALAAISETGIIPELEVCAIERSGNAYRGGRGVLKVAGQIWTIPKKTTQERLDILESEILQTVLEISKYYKIYKKLNK